ncbi:MAG: 1-acyl-sn-glycerol-3-phosphate acyltransferase [Candidatus Scalindua rubra]|uniref:1-acyl-sn-glycerol-3-phosphate acyltransferase n=1 Tax=Candidatus Scalindua rubra TaxID=1872076 RepID=A0A1E3XHN9_9BACT|nr:MAG: 1-acyl-sn-glycerol-3-phosphate acyltransferase [Candidatus Scalindua rubra]
MEKSIKAVELVKNKKPLKLLVGHITILALIFTAGKATSTLSTQKIMILTGSWTIILLGVIALRSTLLNSIITNKNFQTHNLNKENSSKLLTFLDVTFFLIIRGVDILILKVFFKIEAINTHLIPKDGAIIITANHTSHIDSMILQATFPRRITYMLLSKYFETWGKWFFKSQHVIPIKEQGVNCEALKEGLELLKNCGTLGIFPEGKMSTDGNLQEGKHGISFLAIKSEATIVPAYIDGAFEVLPAGAFSPRFFRKIKIIYGEPIYFNNKYINERESREQFTNRVMDEIKKLYYLKDFKEY